MAKFPNAGRGMEWGEKEPVTPETLPLFVERLRRDEGVFVLATYTQTRWYDRKAWDAWERAGKPMIRVAKDGHNFLSLEGQRYVHTQPSSIFWLPRQRMEESMGTMNEIFAAAQAPLFEAEDEAALDAIVEADEAWIAEHFEAADADRLDFYADLLEAAARGPLTEQQQLALEGLRSFIKKKLAPGTKMVFGKVVKVGKAAVGAAKAVGKAAVTAKRGVQAHTFRFTAAGKQARAAAKKVRDTKGRAAGKKSWATAKETYKAASRAGETRGYAAPQTAKAQGKTDKRTKTAEYGPLDKAGKAKAKAVGGKPQRGRKGAPPAKGKKAPTRRGRKGESMEAVFGMIEAVDNE
jgi:hypothetical protein